jgi:hypothetical protein
VKLFPKAHPMDYAQVVGDQNTAAFNAPDSSLPVTLLIDKRGRVRFRHVGLTRKDAFETESNQLPNE